MGPDGSYTYVSSGDDQSCAVNTEGYVTCWGETEFGVLEAPPARFQIVSSGWNSACGITVDNEVLCWGSNQSGQLDVPQD